MKFVITNTMTLWEAVQQLAPDSSKTTLREWIHEGRVLVDGKPVKKNAFILQAGQTIELAQRKKTSLWGMTILYEDPHLVVIDKPSGLLSVSTESEKQRTAFALLKGHYHRPVYVVHRLDQDTSGVMVFARTESALGKLKDKFAEHDIKRSYSAIVEGEMKEQQGTWDCLLYEDNAYFVHVTKDPKKGQRAISHYRVEKVDKGYSWLDITLETGRKNQIRVQSQAAGHSVAGDYKYGAKTDPFRRLCLHARLLAFNHPITGKPMTFESPIPWKNRCIKTPAG